MTQPKDAKRLTSGQVGPKCRVWGGSPTSIFSGPSGPEKSKCQYTCPACRLAKTRNLPVRNKALDIGNKMLYSYN